MNEVCLASADENGFVMDYDQAYNLIAETYPGFLEVTENLRVSDWQGAKKAYHGQKGFKMDLDKYPNISKEDLATLQNTDGGLIVYVQKGGKLPPPQFIRDFQQKIYDFCHNERTEVNYDAIDYGKNTGDYVL